jgi:hypothetical protein
LGLWDLKCVGEWGKKGAGDEGGLVVFREAFGDVRFDQRQYEKLSSSGLLATAGQSLKLVLVVYPHVLKELQQYDRVPYLLQSIPVLSLCPPTPACPNHYTTLFTRMLQHPKHAHKMTAVLALAMKGLGHYMNHVGRAEPHLKQLGLKVYADAQLQEYANLLDGFLLSQRGAAFSIRGCGSVLGQDHLSQGRSQRLRHPVPCAARAVRPGRRCRRSGDSGCA